MWEILGTEDTAWEKEVFSNILLPSFVFPSYPRTGWELELPIASHKTQKHLSDLPPRQVGRKTLTREIPVYDAKEERAKFA